MAAGLGFSSSGAIRERKGAASACVAAAGAGAGPVSTETEEDEEAGADFTDGGAGNSDPGFTDSLDDGAHDDDFAQAPEDLLRWR